MSNRQISINKMIKLSQRLNEIVESLKSRKEAMLSEMHQKAA
ncbi:hypothetical protein [Lonsdalea quercina]